MTSHALKTVFLAAEIVPGHRPKDPSPGLLLVPRPEPRRKEEPGTLLGLVLG